MHVTVCTSSDLDRGVNRRGQVGEHAAVDHLSYYVPDLADLAGHQQSNTPLV